MRLPKVSISTFRTVLIICLSIGLASLFAVRADNPSPIGWNLSGGGFCKGTYTIFNTTLTPNPGLYAENCATGKNDFFSATDLGALANSVFGAMTQGGEVDLRVGYYSVVTSIVFNRNSISFIGTVSGGDNKYYTEAQQPQGFMNGTLLVAKTSGMTMIKGTSAPTFTTSLAWTHINIANMQLYAGCQAARGIDLSSFEASTYNIIRNVMFGVRVNLGNPGGLCGFSQIALVMDGNEDSTVEDSAFAGALETGRGGAPVDLQWQVTGGNVLVVNDMFGGAISLQIAAQTVSIIGGTVNSIKLIGLVWLLYMSGTYFANFVSGQTPTGHFNLNGNTLEEAKFDGTFFVISGAGASPAFAMWQGPGTVSNQGWSGCSAFFTNGLGTWTTGTAPTLTKQVSTGDNHVHSGTTPTGFPFTVDGNGNF